MIVNRLAQSFSFLVVIWALHLSGVYTIMGSWGISPGAFGSIPQDMAAMTLLHNGNFHIYANTTVLAPTLLVLAILDRSPLLTLAVLSVGSSGLLWFIADPFGPIHRGSSGVACALVAYLVVYGFREGSVKSVVAALVIGFFFGMNTILSAMPMNTGVSWEGHLSGIIAGAAWGLFRPK